MNFVQEIINRENVENGKNDAVHDLDKSDNFDCSICLENIDNGEKIRVLQCGHIFHTGCVEPWVTKYFTCPYCRHCEADMECYWLSLKSYGLSWINKLRKYKYTLKPDHIEIARKRYIHRINLHFIHRLYSMNNTIVLFFLDGKKMTLLFRNAYEPFMALKRCLNDYYKRQRLEIQRQQIQYQIHQVERLHDFIPTEAWVEQPHLEDSNHLENQNYDQVEDLD
jgi:hypothetical protein